jgi:hypothetical protein
MLSNQFRLLLSGFAYVLMQHLRRLADAGSELATMQVQTIRTKLLKVAARVTVSARRILFRLARQLSAPIPLAQAHPTPGPRLSRRVNDPTTPTPANPTPPLPARSPAHDSPQPVCRAADQHR